MKTTEEFLDTKLKEKGFRIGWTPESKQAVMEIMQEYKDLEWVSVKEKLPDDLSYHLVKWELEHPYPERGQATVKGTRSAMCEIYKDKKWYGENGIPVNGITHWMPSLEVPNK